MATTATPMGAEPTGALSSNGSFSGKVQHIPIVTTYATAIFYGDFVKLAVTGTVQKDVGTATLTPVGIFMGCNYTDPTTGQFTCSQQWPAANAATDAVAIVAVDPDILFRMQVAGSFTQAYLNANAAITQTAGDVAFGRSKNAVTLAGAGATATLPLRVVDFVDGPDSSVADTYTDIICKFNVGHIYQTATGSALS